MKTYSVKIEFSRPLDYDGLSDEVIIWALKRYEEEIAEISIFPTMEMLLFAESRSFAKKNL